MLGYLIPSWWSCLGGITRCGLMEKVCHRGRLWGLRSSHHYHLVLLLCHVDHTEALSYHSNTKPACPLPQSLSIMIVIDSNTLIAGPKETLPSLSFLGHGTLSHQEKSNWDTPSYFPTPPLSQSFPLSSLLIPFIPLVLLLLSCYRCMIIWVHIKSSILKYVKVLCLPPVASIFLQMT